MNSNGPVVSQESIHEAIARSIQESAEPKGTSKSGNTGSELRRDRSSIRSIRPDVNESRSPYVENQESLIGITNPLSTSGYNRKLPRDVESAIQVLYKGMHHMRSSRDGISSTDLIVGTYLLNQLLELLGGGTDV